jgi:DNA topoisomerase IA
MDASHVNSTTVVSSTSSSTASASVSTVSTVSLDWSRHRVFTKDVATAYHKLVSTADIARVVDVNERDKKKTRPTPLNTGKQTRVATICTVGPLPIHPVIFMCLRFGDDE